MSLRECNHMKKNNEYEKQLKSCGLKATKHRLEILNILEFSKQPLSAEQIFMNMIKNDISISFSTVYRTLETLVSKELVNKQTVLENKTALFEYNKMIHKHYLICIGCKKIKVIEGCPLNNYEKDLSTRTNFEIIGHKLDIYGYCPECKNSII